jgi:hypothetical protein
MTQKIIIVDRKEAAAAEVIGFIYIFGIVMLSISLIYVMGYPVLQSSMDDSIFESAEQTFIILQSNMKMVAFDQVPVANLNIQLQSGALSVSNNSNITVVYKNYTSTSEPIKAEGEIEYQKNDRFLTYENGGVWKQYPSGNVMVSDPRIYNGTTNDGKNITSIGLVSISGISSMGGKGIATLNMQYNSSEPPLITPSQVNVTISINSTYARQWGNYLNSTGFDTVNLTDSSLIAKRNNTWLVLGTHTVNVTII